MNDFVLLFSWALFVFSFCIVLGFALLDLVPLINILDEKENLTGMHIYKKNHQFKPEEKPYSIIHSGLVIIPNPLSLYLRLYKKRLKFGCIPPDRSPKFGCWNKHFVRRLMPSFTHLFYLLLILLSSEGFLLQSFLLFVRFLLCLVN